MESFLLILLLIFLIFIHSKVNSLRDEMRYMNERIDALLLSKTQTSVPEKVVAVRQDIEIHPPAAPVETENEVIRESVA